MTCCRTRRALCCTAKVRGKASYHIAAFEQADGAQNGARGKVAEGAPSTTSRTHDATPEPWRCAARPLPPSPPASLPMGPGECVPITMRSISRSRRKLRIWSAARSRPHHDLAPDSCSRARAGQEAQDDVFRPGRRRRSRSNGCLRSPMRPLPACHRRETG
jgi:hypothetical protein